MEPKVVLVRHGHTKLNGASGTSVDRIRGWEDVPLNEEGRRDAERASQELQKKYDIDCIYSSDLGRAVETARICNVDNLPIEARMELRPWNLGIFQGKVTKEIIGDLNNMVRHEDIVPKDGEAFRDFRERFLTCMIEIIREAIEYGYQTAVFTHYRDLKCMDSWIKKGCPDDLSIDVKAMMVDDFKPGALYELPLDSMDLPDLDEDHDDDEDYDDEE